MQEFFHGAAAFFLYVIPTAGVTFAIRALTKIPDELFRKILHFILLGAYVPFLFAFETWWISAAFAATIVVIFYPILMLAGRIPAFSSFVNERKRGEFKSSLVLALGMMAVSICIGWGWLGDKHLVLACVYAWGVGDAFAALVGKRFGKHKIHWKYADPHKSWEGSAAMFLSSALAVVIVLVLRGGLSTGSILLIAAAAALTCTTVELCTRGGFDTITCPTAAMVVVIPLMQVLSNI